MNQAIINRIVFLITGIIAGSKIISGMDTYSDLTTFYFTVAFGVLLLACLLLLLMGFEIMENNFVAIVAALIPISLSLGMINNRLSEYHLIYAIIIGIAFLIAIYLRFYGAEKIASLSFGFIHGVSGIVIVLIPIVFLLNGSVEAQYGFVSLGGIFIGIGGMLMAFIKAGKPILSKEKVLSLFPVILFFATTAFVVGLSIR